MGPAVSGLGAFERKYPTSSSVAVNEQFCEVYVISRVKNVRPFLSGLVGEEINRDCSLIGFDLDYITANMIS
jgi:hypothetical protein